MSPERWQHVKEVLGATLDRSAEERAAFLAAACAGDEELRAEVLSLLASHEDNGDFLEQPVGSAPRIEECEDDLINAAVGAYRIVSKITAAWAWFTRRSGPATSSGRKWLSSSSAAAWTRSSS